ncbi:MAG TPA: class I SAM-dependent methyltransferase [Candidatus Binatia bacterium]|nr:class I SAM-dependent methyltransferase [Candidatus Binatia bacterium]
MYRITHATRDLVRAIERCESCGLGVLPARLREDVKPMYQAGEDPAYMSSAAERVRNAQRLLALLPSMSGRLLDVGCATGFLLVAARDLGFDVQGIEPSHWAAEYARREFGLDVWRGVFEEAPIPGASVDVVVLADAIEHLTAPRAAVASAYRALAPGGRLLILTPDLGSWTARLAGVHWWGLLDDHYYYFDRRTLAQLLESEGFVVERQKSFGREFPLQHWLYKLSQYSTGLERAASGIARGLRMDQLRISVDLGDQMVCIARKPTNR